MDDFDQSSSDDNGLMDFVMNKDISRTVQSTNKLKHAIGKTLRPGGPDKHRFKSLNLSQAGRHKIGKYSKSTDKKGINL